jgi:hypothetical protein
MGKANLVKYIVKIQQIKNAKLVLSCTMSYWGKNSEPVIVKRERIHWCCRAGKGHNKLSMHLCVKMWG